MVKRTNDQAPPQGRPTHLRLVVSNPDISQLTREEGVLGPSQASLLDMGFKTRTRKLGGVYEMVMEDDFHGLNGDFYLELEKYRGEWTAICHIPPVFASFNRFLDEDETLYGVIAIQFQLKALQRLFWFSHKHKASGLLLYLDNDQAQGYEVYRNFLAEREDALSADEYATEMFIPVTPWTIKGLTLFTQESIHKMEQGLWHDQKSNLAIRQYLKSRIRHEWESSLIIH